MENNKQIIRQIKNQIIDLKRKVIAVNGGIEVNTTIIRNILARIERNKGIPGDDVLLLEINEELERQYSALDKFNESIIELYDKLDLANSGLSETEVNQNPPEKI